MKPHRMFLCALLCVAPALTFGQGRVAIQNSDFEQLDETKRQPAGWQYIEPKDGDGSLAAGKGHGPGRAAQITCTRRTEGWGPGFGQSGVVTVKGDQWYEARFWARAEGLSRGAFVALRDTTDWKANRLWQRFFPGPSWREYRFKFHSAHPLPAKVSRLQFSFDSTGSLWIDDVRITESEPEKPANVLDVAGRKNLLPNSSFEAGAFGWATYGADALVGEVDPATAAHGTRSFRIALSHDALPVYRNDFTYKLRGRPSHDTILRLPVCPLGYCPVEKGQPVTFSFHVRGSKDGVPVVANVLDGRGRATTRKFRASTAWTRFSFTATPGSDIAFPTLGIDATPDILPVTLWVDALQLERGASATAYEPSFPVECALDTGREGNVYLRGEPVSPTLRACNHGDARETAHVRVEAEDFFGKRTEVFDGRLTTEPAAVQQHAIPTGIAEPGFYRLHLTVAGRGWRTSRSIRAAVIYPFEQEFPGADGFLGTNHAFVSDLYMRRARAMGVTWVRSWFCKWQDVEPEPGKFDFGEAERQYAWLRQFGMHVQICLGDPTSEWASSAPEALSASTGSEAQSRRVWWLPKSFDSYERYVREVAARFKGKVTHYEVFNEPSNRKGGEGSNLDLVNTYPRFLERAKAAIASVSPDNRLMGAGLGYFRGADDLSPIVRKIDVLSEHRYPGLSPTANMLRHFTEVRQKLRDAGGERPIWITEYGIYADDDPDPTTARSRFMQHFGHESERLAATHVAKHHVVALASGVDRVFFHIGNWPFRVNREHGCGFHAFFEWGGVPRKTYVVLNTLAYLLPPGSRHSRTWTGPNHVFAFEFERGRGHVTALWAEGGATLPPEALAALRGAAPAVVSVCGSRLAQMPATVEDSPIYLITADGRQRDAVHALLRSMGANAK